MATAINNIWNRFFGSHLDFRVWQFNVISTAGILVCLVTLALAPFSGCLPRCFIITIVIGVYQAGILLYSIVRGNYMFCYIATIAGTFFVGYACLFFMGGGYRGYMPSFFVFAVVMTAFLLDGKKRIAVIAVELAFYISLCCYYYANQRMFNTTAYYMAYYVSDRHVFFSAVNAFLTVSISLAVTMTLQINLYRQRMRELDAARRKTEEYAEMNSELFAQMSHEMRTPLTVMSAYAQYAVKRIKKDGANDQTLAGLSTISEEAKRLADMANGALRVLTAAGGADAEEEEVALISVGGLCTRLAEMFKPIAEQKVRTLTATVANDIPPIRGDAAALTQLLWNLLQNAITFADSSVNLTAEARAPGVKITVRNDGRGVDPEILPRVFERGVSGQGGGSGMGLAVCRDIAARHNGEIAIESDPGSGACVTVILNGV